MEEYLYLLEQFLSSYTKNYVELLRDWFCIVGSARSTNRKTWKHGFLVARSTLQEKGGRKAGAKAEEVNKAHNKAAKILYCLRVSCVGADLA